MKTILACTAAAIFLSAQSARADAPCDPETAIQGAGIAADNPPLMAIGDSVFNGVESLSLTYDKAKLSPPKQVAQSLNLRMTVPNYSEPFLLDLDQDLQNVIYFAITAKKHVRNGISVYADVSNPSHPKSSVPLFDNIAVAQADSHDLMCSNWAISNGFVGKNYEAFKKSKDLPADIEGWFYALNARFILNPTNDARYANLSQLDEALLRKPRKLLINIGSNDGVWKMAFNGYTVDGCYAPEPPPAAKGAKQKPPPEGTPVSCAQPHEPKVRDSMADFVGNMTKAATLLKAHTPDTVVYMDLLPRPSAAANLVPVRGAKPLPGNPGYWSQYENQLSFVSSRQVSGADVAQMDAFTDQINSDAVNAVCAVLGPDHVTFVDLPELLKSYDAKSPAGGHTVPVKLRLGADLQDTTLNNMNVDVASKNGFFVLSQGGLFSYDNMHPTAMGYALLANAIVNTMEDKARHTRKSAGGCTIAWDDTAQISYQDIADALHTTHPVVNIATALDIDGSGHDLLGYAHSYLAKKGAQSASHQADSRTVQTLMRVGDSPNGHTATEGPAH